MIEIIIFCAWMFFMFKFSIDFFWKPEIRIVKKRRWYKLERRRSCLWIKWLFIEETMATYETKEEAKESIPHLKYCLSGEQFSDDKEIITKFK